MLKFAPMAALATPATWGVNEVFAFNRSALSDGSTRKMARAAALEKLVPSLHFSAAVQSAGEQKNRAGR